MRLITKKPDEGQPIIFLDVDGVLNNDFTKEFVPNTYFIGVDDYEIELLADLVRQSGAAIVLSSSWKDGWKEDGKYDDGLKYLIKKMEKYNLEIAGITPDARTSIRRGEEIHAVLEELSPSAWVVLDDEYFGDFCRFNIGKHLVHTSQLVGLTKENVESAIGILNNILTELSEEEIKEQTLANEWEDFDRRFRRQKENDEKER